MSGYYQVTKLISDEKQSKHLLEARIHHQVKLAKQSTKEGSSSKYLEKVSSQAGHMVRQLADQASNALRAAHSVRPVLR